MSHRRHLPNTAHFHTITSFLLISALSDLQRNSRDITPPHHPPPRPTNLHSKALLLTVLTILLPLVPPPTERKKHSRKKSAPIPNTYRPLMHRSPSITQQPRTQCLHCVTCSRYLEAVWGVNRRMCRCTHIRCKEPSLIRGTQAPADMGACGSWGLSLMDTENTVYVLLAFVHAL